MRAVSEWTQGLFTIWGPIRSHIISRKKGLQFVTMKIKKVSVLAVLSAPFLVICALFVGASMSASAAPVTEIPPPIVVTKVIVGPNTNSPYYVPWKEQVIASLRSDSFPVAVATAPTYPEFLGVDTLDPRHLVSSPLANPSWKGVFTPPVGFEGATGTCLWLWVKVKGSALTLSSVVGNTLSSDGLLNTSNQTFSTYGGSLGVDETGTLVTSGSSATVVKELYFGIKMKSFSATNQMGADQIIAYVNRAANYWVMFTVSGQDGSNSYSASRTLNTKALPSYGNAALIQDPSGSWVVVGNSGVTMVVQTSADLITWQDLGAYSPGEFLPLLRSPVEVRRFYRLTYPAPQPSSI